jgi:hypothetical protein
MKLIIDISKDIYNDIVNYNLSLTKADELCRAVVNGTPLPEPFDLEGLKSDMKALNCGFPYGLDYLLDCLNKRLGITITEAEMNGGGEDEVSD